MHCDECGDAIHPTAGYVAFGGVMWCKACAYEVALLPAEDRHAIGFNPC